MKRIVYAAVICTLAVSACTTPFKKAKDGTEYKVISNKNGKKILAGDINKSLPVLVDVFDNTVVFRSEVLETEKMTGKIK